MSEINGGCYCGAIRYQVTGEPRGSSLCYCDNCRKKPEHNRARGSVSSRKMSRSSEEGDLSGPERHNLVLLFNVWNNTLLEAREGRTIYRDDRKPRQLGFFPAKRYELRRGSTAAVSPVSGGCRQLTVSSNHLLWKPNRMPADWKSIATLSFLNSVAPPAGP
mgnify:CR=1 FL=1|jgi:hypothetical protein